MNRVLGTLLAAVLVVGVGVAGVEGSAVPAVAITQDEVAPGTEISQETVVEEPASEGTSVGGIPAENSVVETAPDEDTANADDASAPGLLNDEPEPELSNFEVPSVMPTIAGNTAMVGTLASATPGEWGQSDVTFTYQWYRNGIQIAGATAQQYLPVPGDTGATIRVDVTGSKIGFENATYPSVDVLVVEGALISSRPVISGTATVGNSLSVKPGTWTPANTQQSIQWTRDGRNIAGATTTKYVLTAADRGKRIGVTVTGSTLGYLTKTVVSAATTPVLAGKLSPAKPKISGSAIVGKTLRATSAKWKPAGTQVSFQWKRNGKAIPGATKSTYTLKASDGGKRVTVTATGRLAGYTTTSRTSSATKAVLKRFASTATPRISGALRVGSALTVQVKASKPAATSTSYRWYRNGKAISGANGSTYVLKSSDAGKKVSVRVTSKRAGYVTVTKTSAAKRVASIMRASTPRISGSTTVGSQLRVNPGTWTSGAKLTYQWYRNGFKVSGAKGSTYNVTAGDVGSYFAVVVTGKKAGYASETRTSGATALVSYPSRTSPIGGWNCPAWAPIKGNASSMIYHVPGGAFYDRTKPEECFASEAAAQNAGYRRSMR